MASLAAEAGYCLQEPAHTEQAPTAGEEQPCYVQLGMREEGDVRLASVYKPEMRGKLVVRLFAPGNFLRPAAVVGHDAMSHSRSHHAFSGAL